jgi:hypothetical protein
VREGRREGKKEGKKKEEEGGRDVEEGWKRGHFVCIV